MSRILFVPLLAAAFLVAPAMLPQAFAPATTLGLSGSAEAAINLNSSRSNTRTKKTKTTKKNRRPKQPKQPTSEPISTPGGY
jgi:hypothetical protein